MDQRALSAIAKLPAAAADRLAELQLSASTAQDLQRSMADRLQQMPADVHPQMRERLASERGKQQARSGQLAQLNNRILQWLSELHPNTELEMAAPVELDGKPTDVIRDARAQIANLQRQLNQVRRSPLPRAAEIDLIESFVASAMRRASPRVTVTGDQLHVHFADDVITSPSDVFCLFAAIDPDGACNFLERRLGPERPGAMDKTERIKKLAEIEAALELAERTEESAIEAAAIAGTEVMRRVDANPLCVLSVLIKQQTDQQQAVA
jgi:hypothetical protein